MPANLNNSHPASFSSEKCVLDQKYYSVKIGLKQKAMLPIKLSHMFIFVKHMTMYSIL